MCTGATGSLGVELLPLLIAQGYKVYALARHPPEPKDNLIPLQGDVTLGGLGLTDTPGDIDAVMHLAAVVSFDEKKKTDILGTNCIGTLNVLNFCLANKITRLYYVSTAYVCGNFKGTFREADLNIGQKFRNTYETSKFWAEGYVREFARGFGRFHPPIVTTIYRPSIIVGRSSDGHATTFEGFYQPIKALVRVRSIVEHRLRFPRLDKVEHVLHLPRLRIPIAIKGDPEGTLNLVSVDWVAREMVSLMDAEPKTYHLTNPIPLTNSEICKQVCEVLGISGVRFAKEVNLKQPLSRLYNRMIGPFSHYLQGEPIFVTSALLSSAEEFTPPDIRKIVDYWWNSAKKNKGLPS